MNLATGPFFTPRSPQSREEPSQSPENTFQELRQDEPISRQTRQWYRYNTIAEYRPRPPSHNRPPRATRPNFMSCKPAISPLHDMSFAPREPPHGCVIAFLPPSLRPGLASLDGHAPRPPDRSVPSATQPSTLLHRAPDTSTGNDTMRAAHAPNHEDSKTVHQDRQEGVASFLQTPT